MASLVSIVYKPAGPAEETEDGRYLRVPLLQATLVAGQGIEGDAKGTRGRQLNVISAGCAETLARDGFRSGPGQLGEQLIVDGLEIESLDIGTCLQIGEVARVELIQLRNGCARFERYQNKPRKEAAGRIGEIAGVRVGGRIQVGDAVTVVATPQPASPQP